MTKHYVVNKLNTPLDLKSGYLIVPPKGYAEIHERDTEHDTILFALDRNWIEVTKTKPEVVEEPPQEVQIEITEPYAGMTEAELKASQAEEAKVAEAEAETSTEATPETATKPGRKKATA